MFGEFVVLIIVVVLEVEVVFFPVFVGESVLFWGLVVKVLLKIVIALDVGGSVVAVIAFRRVDAEVLAVADVATVLVGVIFSVFATAVVASFTGVNKSSAVVTPALIVVLTLVFEVIVAVVTVVAAVASP